MKNPCNRIRVLHIANWFPNRRNPLEGNFIAAHFACFAQVTDARLVNVQVRIDTGHWLRIERAELGPDQRAVYLLTKIRNERVQALLTTILLLWVLAAERARGWDLLQVHIAWPLLSYAHVWRAIVRSPLLISEHWSAYHFRFHLPDGAPALERLRRPFRQGLPVAAVSQALLDDIRNFSGGASFPGFVLPNYVPLHGASHTRRDAPVLFSVNRWVGIKDPMPMLQGLAEAAEAGSSFRLVIGGLGPESDAMCQFVATSALAGRTEFRGWMTGEEIAAQLAETDAYLFSSKYETFSIACAEALGAGDGERSRCSRGWRTGLSIARRSPRAAPSAFRPSGCNANIMLSLAKS